MTARKADGLQRRRSAVAARAEKYVARLDRRFVYRACARVTLRGDAIVR